MFANLLIMKILLKKIITSRSVLMYNLDYILELIFESNKHLCKIIDVETSKYDILSFYGSKPLSSLFADDQSWDILILLGRGYFIKSLPTVI